MGLGPTRTAGHLPVGGYAGEFGVWHHGPNHRRPRQAPDHRGFLGRFPLGRCVARRLGMAGHGLRFCGGVHPVGFRVLLVPQVVAPRERFLDRPCRASPVGGLQLGGRSSAKRCAENSDDVGVLATGVGRFAALVYRIFFFVSNTIFDSVETMVCSIFCTTLNFHFYTRYFFHVIIETFINP